MVNLRHKAFVAAYLGEANCNATQAAILAGYSPATAKQQGSRLLTRVDVLKAINQKVEKAELSTDRMLSNVGRIANTTPQKVSTMAILKANALILRVNGALNDHQHDSRIQVNIGFLGQPTAALTVTTSRAPLLPDQPLVVTKGNTSALAVLDAEPDKSR